MNLRPPSGDTRGFVQSVIDAHRLPLPPAPTDPPRPRLLVRSKRSFEAAGERQRGRQTQSFHQALLEIARGAL